MCKKQISTIALSIALAFPAAPALAGGGLSGMATEVTQMANNVELIGIYAKEAESVMVQINQYMTMLQNLQQLPASLIQQMFGDAFGDIGARLSQYTQLYSQVSSLYSSAMNVQNMLSTHGQAMMSLNMTPEAYMRNVVSLSRNNQQYFRAMEEDALSGMNSLQQNMSAVRSYSEKIPGVDSNIKGLQQIASGNAIVAGVLVEIRGSMERAAATTARAGQIEEARFQRDAAELHRLQRYVAEMKRRE